MLLCLPGLSPWAEWWPFLRIPIKLRGGAFSNGTCRPLPVCFGSSPIQTWSLPSWWLTWTVCAWPTNIPTVLHMRKPWWFVGGSSQRSTPIGQHFSLNTQKVNQQFTKVCTTNSCYDAGYIFRDSFNQRTNNINNYFPDRLYRQDPATMLGGLFAFAKAVLVHW